MQRLTCMVGTLTLSLALASGATVSAAGPSRAEASPEPVVLIHGWHGAGSADTLAGSSLAPVGQRLRASGFEPVWAAGVAVDPADSLFDSADTLAGIVAETALRHPERPVRIVGHSYGGLVARAFLESDRYTKLREQGVQVSHLVTMGTPMGGIDLWLPLLFVLGDPFGEPSVWELTPAWMAEFNRSHRPPAGTRYTLVAGDARGQVPPLWLLPASDGAVTVASALALPERSLGLTERVTEDVHSATDYTRFFGWRALVDSEATFQRLLLPGLTAGSSTTFSSSGPTGLEAKGLGAQSPAAVSGQHTPVREHVLAPGERVTLSPGAAPLTGWLLLADPGVTAHAASAQNAGLTSTPDGSGPVGAVIPGVRDGVVGRVIPVAGTGDIVVTNTGTEPERIAWLGLLPAGRFPLALTAQATGGGLALRLSAPGSELANVRTTVLGPEGLRSPSVTPHRRDAGQGTLGTSLPAAGGVQYVQVTANVDGIEVQTETTVWVPGTAVAPETH